MGQGVEAPRLTSSGAWQVRKDLLRAPHTVDLENESYIRKAMDAMPDLGRKVEYLLNTGNLVSRNTLDLSQTSGFTVVAEKLNFFRCACLACLSVDYFCGLDESSNVNSGKAMWRFRPVCHAEFPRAAKCVDRVVGGWAISDAKLTLRTVKM